MIIDQLKSRLNDGFRPFSVQLSNGSQFEVLHPDFIALHPKAVVIIDSSGISHTINPIHIVSIDEKSGN